MRSLPEAPRLILTLTLAGLFSGFAIVSAYRLTLPRIQENQARALEEAVFQVVPGSATMQRLVAAGGGLAPPASVDAAGAESIYAAFAADGAFLGYAIPAAGAGFQDTIKLLYGYDPERREILGMQVLESRETPGLGDRIYKDPDFLDEFRGLAVDPRIELVKGSGEEPWQVDAITGATISSAAVVSILNDGNSRWLERLPDQAPAPTGDATTPAPDLERGGPIPGGRSGG